MNEKGFTLIEVMISILLVGILAMSFIPIFASQFANVYRSGDKSEATYDALEKVENKIADPNVKKIESTDTVREDTITFGGKVIDIKVKDIEVLGEAERLKSPGKGKNNDKIEETALKVGVPVPKDTPEQNVSTP